MMCINEKKKRADGIVRTLCWISRILVVVVVVVVVVIVVVCA
jgi:hypothetical protein